MLRQPNGPARPDTFGSRLSSGTKASSSTTSPVTEVRNDSFAAPDFVELARKHNVAVITAGDSKFPQIADPTADFVYVRIMGTDEKHKKGYSEAELDAWAKRAQAYAAGGTPDDLKNASDKEAKKVPRDVYLYVISGHKEVNPAAAMALIERLK